MAVIPGFIKDEVIVLGNHRDGALLALVLTSSHANASLHSLLIPRANHSLGARLYIIFIAPDFNAHHR